MASIRNFTNKGGSVSGVGRSGVPKAKFGHFDPDTGKIFQHPRLRRDQGIGSSGSVRITNPNASAQSTARRTASLGMLGIGQRGRGRDF